MQRGKSNESRNRREVWRESSGIPRTRCPQCRPGLSGRDLAQWRADSYAELLGGTVEKAPTAITQSAWTPRDSSPSTYSREQLDAAFQAMLAEGQKATAQRQSSYLASRAQAGTSADISA
ncbi:hypothetical protein SAMN04487925_10316 [Bradyrhizobium sp. cf659]|nr:hypothetical protein SAMN04487925_10316 [Bradyrhizobium sp. cf659]